MVGVFVHGDCEMNAKFMMLIKVTIETKKSDFEVVLFSFCKKFFFSSFYNLLTYQTGL